MNNRRDELKQRIAAIRDELKQRIAAIRAELTALSAELNEIERAEFLAKSEFKIGDRVVCGGSTFEITGTIHRFSWYFVGRMIKKDGTLGIATRHLYGRLTRGEL